jgi:hypothetical protein
MGAGRKRRGKVREVKLGARGFVAAAIAITIVFVMCVLECDGSMRCDVA